jgi:hypothetical protein
LPQVLGRLGVYATYIAAALVLLVIAGDLDVLLRHPPLVGQLAVLVVVGPLVAMLLSTFASYVNYYGIWRILRGKDEYDAGQDLKSHAADIPQALQALLAGRRGCLPAAATALLFVSLLLAAAADVPPSTPAIGTLGTWHDHVGGVVLIAPTATPTATTAPTATALPTATATARPTATTRPIVVPTATATATSTPPPVINFQVVPPTATWPAGPGGCTGTPPTAVKLTLDNSKSTVAVSWQASADQLLPSGAPWATIAPASGTVAAGGQQTTIVTPASILCRYSSPNGTAWTVTIVTINAGKYTFTYTVF